MVAVSAAIEVARPAKGRFCLAADVDADRQQTRLLTVDGGFDAPRTLTLQVGG